jgi:hypothetical protein
VAKINVQCPGCGTAYTVEEKQLGKWCPCKKCNASFTLSHPKVSPKQHPPVAAEWSKGQLILDEFLVERKLGQGGMGGVYLLRSQATNQPFAVKRALLQDPDSRRNFLAELMTWIDLPERVRGCPP